MLDIMAYTWKDFYKEFTKMKTICLVRQDQKFHYFSTTRIIRLANTVSLELLLAKNITTKIQDIILVLSFRSKTLT